jgi:hypothetical protein
MTNLDSLTLGLDSATIIFLAKAVLVFFLVAYTLFAILILRQVNVMNHTIETIMSRFISTLAQLHLLASLALLVSTILFF